MNLSDALNTALNTARENMALVYCGDERCTFAEAIEDFGGEHTGTDGDFEAVTKDGEEFGMWTDGWGWVAFRADAYLVVTRENIVALRGEAGAAGDEEQVGICNDALSGDPEALAKCEQVIREARRE